MPVVLAVAGLIVVAASAKAIVHVLAIVVIATGVVAGLATAAVFVAVILRSRRREPRLPAPQVINGRAEARLLRPAARSAIAARIPRAITPANQGGRGRAGRAAARKDQPPLSEPQVLSANHG